MLAENARIGEQLEKPRENVSMFRVQGTAYHRVGTVSRTKTYWPEIFCPELEVT